MVSQSQFETREKRKQAMNQGIFFFFGGGGGAVGRWETINNYWMSLSILYEELCRSRRELSAEADV